MTTTELLTKEAAAPDLTLSNLLLADATIISLPALPDFNLNDLYEVSQNGTGSFKETRAQQLTFMEANIAGSPYTIGDLVYANSSVSLGRITATAVGNVLLSNGTGTVPVWGPVNLNTVVTGILPIAHGGTNTNTQTTSGINFFDGTKVTSNANFTFTNSPVSLTLSDQGFLITPPTISTYFNLYSATQVISRITLSGQEFISSSNISKDGIAMLLGVNQTTDRELWLADSLNCAVNSVNPVIRLGVRVLGGGNNFVFIDSKSTDNSTALPITFGNSSAATTIAGTVGVPSLQNNRLVATDSSANLLSVTSGSSGQLLSSNGSGSIPSWVNSNTVGVVLTWDGSNTPVNVTGSSGISIAGGTIALTGTGPSTAYGYLAVQNLSTIISYSDFTTWKPLVGTILSSTVNNFVASNDAPGDPTTPFYLQYIGADTSVFQVTNTAAMRRFSSTTANGYYISISLDGVNPISATFGDRQLSYGLAGQNTQDSEIIAYGVQITLVMNQKVYFVVRNDTNLSSTDNDFLNTQQIVSIQKVGSVGGTSSGVASLNGLTTNLNILSNNSVSIAPVGDNITLETSQYGVVSGTSQSMLENMCYLCTNASLTTLTLPTSCDVGAYLKVAGKGSGLFTIAQNSGQSISMGTSSTTTGTGGSIAAAAGQNNSAIELVCTVANTSFMVVNSQGTFTLT